MAYTDEIFEGLENLDIKAIAGEAIDETREKLMNLQRDQLLHGLRADGKLIGKYRNNKYARVKNQMNPLAGLGNVDLKLTGAVHNELFVDVRDNEYIIDSADSKMADLVEKYDDPLGLTEDNEQIYIDETLEEAFILKVEKQTGL